MSRVSTKTAIFLHPRWTGRPASRRSEIQSMQISYSNTSKAGTISALLGARSSAPGLQRGELKRTNINICWHQKFGNSRTATHSSDIKDSHTVNSGTFNVTDNAVFIIIIIHHLFFNWYPEFDQNQNPEIEAGTFLWSMITALTCQEELT